ncbi:MAG: BamA/TamA family outer membrane protein [Limnospira sp. PMC 1291.21]|uniref:BamA/TamA family outer membrane protein n=1 Tax=unclassified Limnospira TaxID=2642885 RepID=UPI0028E0FEA2|nr:MULTISPECIES: BamA/TamA family outer membrane protein [unclassified Limnospira]MDT9249670.1 BamA/TamA family outer membrane protein [Limnospira sp. PMC 1280.21]MDT9305710.1 BamA/TamA family outer membrane protein [Limnospira sp. PMC 1291.21]
MSKNVNNMGFCSFWVACLATSATFGLSNSASGKTPPLIFNDYQGSLAVSDQSNDAHKESEAIAIPSVQSGTTSSDPTQFPLFQLKNNDYQKLADFPRSVSSPLVALENVDDSLVASDSTASARTQAHKEPASTKVEMGLASWSENPPTPVYSPFEPSLGKPESKQANFDVMPSADQIAIANLQERSKFRLPHSPQDLDSSTKSHLLTPQTPLAVSQERAAGVRPSEDWSREPQWVVNLMQAIAYECEHCSLDGTRGQENLELAQNNLPPSVPGTGQPGEPDVLIAEVLVSGTDNEQLVDVVYGAIAVQPGRTATRSQLQQDINAIFATGLFRNVRAVPEDTPLGVRVTFDVEPNPPLQQVIIEGDQVLPSEVVDASFANQFGQIINLRRIEEAIDDIQTWYQQNGYVLAQVIAAPDVTTEGVVTLRVAEGVISEIIVRFLNADGDPTDPDGNPVTGRTRDFIITREIQLQPGDVFNQATIQQDLGRVFRLGIFDDVRLQLEPAPEDPTKANMIVNVIERSTGSVAFGGGFSSATGLFGTLSYREANLGGNNHQLAAEVQVGEQVLLVDLSFTDPWIAGDPYRTSYTVNAFRRRGISLVFEEGSEDVRLPNEDRPRVIRTGGGISFTRPFAENPFVDPDWVASLGFQYQRAQVTDSRERITPRDERGKLLSASESGEDDLFTVQFGLATDRRNNRQIPTSGYAFRFGTEQSIPIGSGNIFFNRVRGSYSHYIPVNFLQLVPGAPQALAFNIQAGTIMGDFPPYEAFPLGGANTVRGWREGALAAARSFVLGSVEYRFPVFSVANFLIGGALFIDGAHALGTQSSVQGNPGGIRGKPGSGIGFGGGVRIQSPLGPIRIDYGINDEGGNQIHFGIGERF